MGILKGVDDKVKDAIERHSEAEEAWAENYEAAQKDLDFYDSENQWDDQARKYLKARNQLALTLNKIPKFVNRVANQIRLNTPSINVDPIDDGSDVDTAEILQGLIRNIEAVSGADMAYDNAVTCAIKGGIGFFRIDHDYAAPDTFEQHILIKSVVNPLSVLIDPLSTEMDGSDSRYAFVTDKLPKDEFEKLYPDAKPVGFDASSYERQETRGDVITIAEHFYIKPEQVEIGLMADGSVIMLSENMGVSPIKTRTITKNKVYRCKLTGSEVLEESIFPAAYIPLIPVYGDVHWMEGKRYTYSLIRNMKEAQRLYNLGKSLEVALLKKAPKNQWVAAEGQVHGYEGQWKNPDAVETLIYKPADVKGQVLPPPRREAPPPVPQGVMALSASALEDLKDISGIYDASLGMRSNETSGIAIQQRQNEADLATAHFEDNLRRSIRHAGRIIMDMIPRIYDTERVIRVIGKEQEQKLVRVNSPVLMDGQLRPYDIRTGKYDINVTTGQSYASKRQESAAFMTEVIRGNPQLMGVIGDLAFKNMDVAGAEAIASRLKKTIPPQLLDESEREQDQPQVDPEKEQMAMMLQQAQQAMAQMQAQVQALEGQAQNNQAEAQIKAMSEQAKFENDRIKLELEARKLELEQQKIEIEAFKAQTEAMKPAAEAPEQAPQMMTTSKPQEDEMALDVAELEALLTAKKTKAEQEAIAEQIKAAREAEKEQMEALQKQALMEAILGVKQSVDSLVMAVSAPKKIVRDENGQITGTV